MASIEQLSSQAFYTNMILHRDALIALCGYLEGVVHADTSPQRRIAQHKAVSTLVLFLNYPIEDYALSAVGLTHMSYLRKLKVFENAQQFVEGDIREPRTELAAKLLIAIQGLIDMSKSQTLEDWKKQVALPLKQ